MVTFITSVITKSNLLFWAGLDLAGPVLSLENQASYGRENDGHLDLSLSISKNDVFTSYIHNLYS